MNRNTLLVVFIIVALVATAAFADIGKGKLGILLPAKPGQDSEVLPINKKELKALRDGSITIHDFMLAKSNGVVDTLKSPVEYDSRFGASPGDTMMMYFRPPASLIVKSIGMNFTDIDDGGDCHVVNLSLAYSNYDIDTHPVDSVNADGWLGTFVDGVWTGSSYGQYPIQWEAGHLPLWGEFPVTVTEINTFVFTDMIYMGFEPDVGREDFLCVMAPVGAPEGTIRWMAGTAPSPEWRGMKSYAVDGTSGNAGWHVRTFGWIMYAVVEFYENTPPNVTIAGGPYGTVLNGDARTLQCAVADIDANDPNQAGAAEVKMMYSVNGGAVNEVACTLASGTDANGVWDGVVPAGALVAGDVLTYSFEATDKAGLVGQSVEGSYGYFKAENDILVFYNDDGGSYPSWILSPYYDNLWGMMVGEDFVAYPYDVWVGLSDGALSAELVNMYDMIVQIDAHSPATMNDDVIGAWFASGTKSMFWSSQEWGYALTDGADSTFAADDWHNMYMGIGTIGPMDINYPDPGDQAIFPVNAVAGDPISGGLADFVGDSLQLYYSPYDELGFSSWCDAMVAADGATVCMTDSAQGLTMGVYKETNGTKTVFLTFDQLSLDTYALPSYTATDGYHWTEPNEHSLAGTALTWFGASTDVEDNNVPSVAAKYSLDQNYPNPFNPETRITYSISQPGQVKLAVYNVLGQKVADLVDDYKVANTYKVTFDATKLTSGVYFYRLEVGDYSKTMKMMLLR